LSTDEVLKIAHTLGEALSRTEAWQGVLAARHSIMRDEEAYQLLAQYQDASAKIERKNQDGLTITQAEIENIENMQEKLAVNSLIGSLQEPQERFSQLMHSIYFAIEQALEGSFDTGGSKGEH